MLTLEESTMYFYEIFQGINVKTGVMKILKIKPVGRFAILFSSKTSKIFKISKGLQNFQESFQDYQNIENFLK